MIKEFAWSKGLRPEVVKRWDELVQLRRTFHQHPELSRQEHQTSQQIKEWLAAHGIEEVQSKAGTGVVALVRGARPGPTVMYRCDMDGLPIQEASGVEFSSKNEGVMHSCGHDGHMAVALMLAFLVHQRRRELSGNVKVVFQPAEEVFGGAQPMIDEGVLDGPPVDAVLGLHVGTMPVGLLGVSAGATLSGVATYRIRVLGKGGHAASPHKTVDPIVVGAQLVSALQTIVSRNVDPAQAAVVTVGTFHAGTKENIIPESAELTGTIRAFQPELLETMAERVRAIAKGTAEAMGAQVEFHRSIDCPPNINDPTVTERVHRHAVDLVGADSVRARVVSAGDDMAYFLQRAPGCYFHLGGTEDAASLHQPHFTFDDRALALGLELSLRVIDDYLAS